jgi:hypothetical protein
MNQLHQRLWQGCAMDSPPAFVRCLNAAPGGVADRATGARRGAWKPVAYSILFQ